MASLRNIGLLIALTASFVAGCGGRSNTAALTGFQQAPEVPPSEYETAGALLAGYEVAPPEERWAQFPGWRFGDRVLFGLRLVKGGQATVRYIDVELLNRTADPSFITIETTTAGGKFRFQSILFATRIRLHDDAGELLAEIEGAFPMLLANVGVFDAARFELEARAAGRDPRTMPVTKEEYRRAGLGWLGMVAFSGSLGSNTIFTELVQEVVRRPAWWRILLKPSFALEDAAPGPTEAPPWSPRAGLTRPAYRVPLRLSIAGRPALEGVVTVVPPDAPLGLGSGLIHAEAHRPDDPSIRMEIRLLGARRGPYVAPVPYDGSEHVRDEAPEGSTR